METNTATATDIRCSCCGTETIPPTPGTDEEGYYCEGCGAAWITPAGMAPHSCLIHRS